MPWDREHPFMYLQESLCYKVCDTDDSGNPKYYGFVNKSGKWMIMNETDGATNSFRYCSGESDYPTNWTNRASLTYGYYDEVF